MTIGKNAIRNATRTFGSRPNPNHTRSRGAIATFGMAWDEINSGSTMRENAGHMKMPNASGTPMTMLVRYPSRISTVVTQVFLSTRGPCSMMVATTWLGGGARKLGMSNARTTTSQRTMIPTMVATGYDTAAMRS